MTRDAFGMVEFYGLEAADRSSTNVGLVSGNMVPRTGCMIYSVFFFF